jgi:DNA invertase Pin-like site-specific DNA recombinase
MPKRKKPLTPFETIVSPIAKEIGMAAVAASFHAMEELSCEHEISLLERSDDFGPLTERERDLATQLFKYGVAMGYWEAARRTHEARRNGSTVGNEKRAAAKAMRVAAIKAFYAAVTGTDGVRMAATMKQFKVSRGTVYNALNDGE